MAECGIKEILTGNYVMEGAGVKLKRVFGFHDTSLTDPFLLFDHFGSKNPDDYIKGFPWHPHRGIETVTYMLNGRVEHGDSLGNKGVIGPGDVQWMTAGSGIVHQEMPEHAPDYLSGFQLWVNLPAENKMSVPKYRDISSENIPVYSADGIQAKVISGNFKGVAGASDDISGSPMYADISLTAGKDITIDIPDGYKAFCYLYKGSILTGFDKRSISSDAMIIFDMGPGVSVSAVDDSSFIFFAGRPLNEPVAWRGPIVMNTAEELDTAFNELSEGTFIKHRLK
ncbi:MAG: pirin family protein [Spirochaetes bacterium]|nr:pirin family protein [Spirochaetota bacterium]